MGGENNVSGMKGGLELKRLRNTHLDHRPWFLVAKWLLRIHG